LFSLSFTFGAALDMSINPPAKQIKPTGLQMEDGFTPKQPSAMQSDLLGKDMTFIPPVSGGQLYNQASSSDNAGLGNYHLGAGGGRHKTVRQQEANRIAQQRYRERKKQKFQELERTVDELRDQLSDLQALQQRNNILEGMNSQLQKSLIEKEREIERLKLVLDAQADASLGASGDTSDSCGGHHHHQQQAAEPDKARELVADKVGSCQFKSGEGEGEYPSVPCDILPRDLTGIDFKAGFADQIKALREFMNLHDLESTCDMTVKTLTPELLKDLAQIVGRSCQLCQAAIRAEGIKVLDLIQSDATSLSSTKEATRAVFDTALDKMNLSAVQQQQIMLHRKAHLERMREIYAERQNLNFQAMALMLPSRNQDPALDNTVEGKLENIATRGYLPVAKSNAELAIVLDSMKDNLRREQRSAMDLNCATVSKILTPLQAAHFMSTVYPNHCDALALANVLAHRLGDRS
jgi:hypothetical protein